MRVKETQPRIERQLQLVTLGRGPRPQRIVGHARTCDGHGWYPCPAAGQAARLRRSIDGTWFTHCCCGGCVTTPAT